METAAFTDLSDHFGFPRVTFGLVTDAAGLFTLKEIVPESKVRPAESVAVVLAEYVPLRHIEVSIEIDLEEELDVVETRLSDWYPQLVVRIVKHQDVISLAPG